MKPVSAQIYWPWNEKWKCFHHSVRGQQIWYLPLSFSCTSLSDLSQLRLNVHFTLITHDMKKRWEAPLPQPHVLSLLPRGFAVMRLCCELQPTFISSLNLSDSSLLDAFRLREGPLISDECDSETADVLSLSPSCSVWGCSELCGASSEHRSSLSLHSYVQFKEEQLKDGEGVLKISVLWCHKSFHSSDRNKVDNCASLQRQEEIRPALKLLTVSSSSSRCCSSTAGLQPEQTEKHMLLCHSSVSVVRSPAPAVCMSIGSSIRVNADSHCENTSSGWETQNAD